MRIILENVSRVARMMMFRGAGFSPFRLCGSIRETDEMVVRWHERDADGVFRECEKGYGSKVDRESGGLRIR